MLTIQLVLQGHMLIKPIVKYINHHWLLSPVLEDKIIPISTQNQWLMATLNIKPLIHPSIGYKDSITCIKHHTFPIRTSLNPLHQIKKSHSIFKSLSSILNLIDNPKIQKLKLHKVIKSMKEIPLIQSWRKKIKNHISLSKMAPISMDLKKIILLVVLTS